MSATGTTSFICLFHDAGRGGSALKALENAGFPRTSISVLGDAASRVDGNAAVSLENLNIPDRDLVHLREGLNKGGLLLALEAPESRSAEIERIFHKYSADKIDEADVDATPVPLASSARDTGEAVVPVAQEDLVVGKREVDRGGVRVLRRVVQEPVAETVNLRSEQVVIDRRPADRAISNADIAAASQVIELTETAEVPVVTKTARVVEEVRVGLEQTDRTETVQDTVRHTEVDVEPVQARTSARN